MRRKNPLSNVDISLLHMDSPNNLMIITGLMTLETHIDVQDLRETIEQRLLSYNRFRQRIIHPRRPMKRPYWQDDPKFNIDNHLIIIDRPLPHDQQILSHLVSELLSVPLNPNRPLWQMYLVQNYGQGSALICRFHHVIADGIALMGVFLSLTDREAAEGGSPFIALQSTHAAKNGMGITDRAIRARNDLLRDRESGLRVIRKGADAFASMGRFVLHRPDPNTILKGELSGHKKAVWAGPVPLAEVKRIGRAFGGTVNDVLLALLAGALRKYLTDHGESITKESLHSFVPVNLRSPVSKEQLGNQFGVVFLSLPVGIDDPVERLYHVIDHMNKLKSSNEAIGTFGLFYILGAVPRIQEAVLSLVDSKGTAITTNVPGPQEQLYLAGSPIETVMAWVPKSGHIGLGISIMSYNGGVWIGISADTQLVPDPEQLVAYYCDEFEGFEKLAEDRWARRRASVEPMIAMLDDALHTMDEVLADTQNGSGDLPSSDPVRCQGMTKSGQRCKNRALIGEVHCRVHLESATHSS